MEDKINKALRQDSINTLSKILDELKHRYPQYVELSVIDDLAKKDYAHGK